MDTIKNAEENVELIKTLKNETVEGLLGKPIWRNEALHEDTFTSLTQFEDALAGWEKVIQQHLLEHDYNSIGNYVDFYRDYTVAKFSTKKKPIDFYRDYKAKITEKHLNCVGLSYSLLKSIQKSDAVFGSYFALVSSQNIPVNSTNCANKFESSNVVKLHVLICLKFVLSEEDRMGYVLIDSGYSFTHPIVVMNDEASPHTGCFEPTDYIRFHYKLLNDRFIQCETHWINQSTGKLEPRPYIDLIFVEKEYLSYETVSHKRSLILRDKSWVIRSDKGWVACLRTWIGQRVVSLRYKATKNSTQLSTINFSIDQLDSEQARIALRIMATLSLRHSKKFLSPIKRSSLIEHNFQRYRLTLRKFRRTLLDESFSRDICVLDKWMEITVKSQTSAAALVNFVSKFWPKTLFLVTSTVLFLRRLNKCGAC